MNKLKISEKIASAIVGEPCIIVTRREWEAQQKRILELEAKVEKLEELLALNSQNSSLPPSSDFPPTKPAHRKKRPRKKGPKKGHEAHIRNLVPAEEVDAVVELNPPEKCACKGVVELTDLPPEIRQIFEIPEIRPHVTEYHLNSGKCKNCGRIHKAQIPADTGNGILGPCAMAWIGIMSGKFHLSKRKIKAIFEDLLHFTISLGTVSNTEKRIIQALDAPYNEAVAHVQNESFVHMDETGHKEKNQRGWVWLCATPLIAVFMVALSRSSKIARSFISDSFKGILISDRYSAYNFIPAIRRQFCWAHLKRDVRKIAERKGNSRDIGLKLLKYIRRMFKLWDQFRRGSISRSQLQIRMKPVRSGILALLGDGARCGHKKTEGFCKRVFKGRDSLFTFVDTDGIEPTNNHAERLIRPYVIWRKNSFFTQSGRGNRFIERIMTVCTTCSLQNRSALQFITDALLAHNAGLQSPSLIPKNHPDELKTAAGF